MKMTVIFLTYLFIIMCSSTLSSNSNNLENIVSELVELNKLAGKSPESISVLVSRMSSSLEKVQNKEAKFFNRVEKNCKSGNQIMKGYIEKLKSDLVEINVTINQANQRSAEAEESKKNFKTQVKSLKTKFEDVSKQINKEWEKFRQFATENEQKLVTIKYVKDIITDELLSKHKKAGRPGRGRDGNVPDSVIQKIKNKNNKKSFIQIETQEFSQRVEDLKTMLSELSSKESVYSTMAVTLLEVAEKKGFSNFKLLQKLVEIFEKLEKNLISFRASWEKSEKKIINDLKVQLKSVKTQIRTIMGMYREASSIVKETRDFVQSSEKNKKSVQSGIERNMIQVSYWDKICQFEAKLKAKSFNWSTSLMHKINNLSSKIARI
jgi:chromosome segregation ATPase